MGTQRRLGSRYTLLEPIGEGASGQVWRGRDSEGNARAFKVLRSELAADPAVVHRFVQERNVLASVRSPYVVGVHDLVVEDSTLAIVMDYVPGGDLRAVIRQHGSIAPGQVATWGAQMALGLGAAHSKGVVHRDVKPENVLLEPSTGQARLTDFGIARILDGTQRSTLLLGTPQYMAPEVAEGRNPSPAADLYALGIVLYELSCGVPPFAGRGSAMATLRAHAVDLPGRPAGVPDPLWDLLSWLLEKSPERRPASAGVVAEALRSQQGALEGVPPAPRLAVAPAPRASLPLTGPAGTEDVTILAGASPAPTPEGSDTVMVDRSAGSRRGASLRPPTPPSLIPAGPVTGLPGYPSPGPVPAGPPPRGGHGLLIGALGALGVVGAFLAAFLLAARQATPGPDPPVPALATPVLPPDPTPTPEGPVVSASTPPKRNPASPVVERNSAGPPCLELGAMSAWGAYPSARCTMWQPAEGLLSKAPLSRGPTLVTCQANLRVPNPVYKVGQGNTWWVWTQADDGSWDWFPQTAVQQGDSERPLNGVAACVA